MNRSLKPMGRSHILLCLMIGWTYPSFSEINTSALFCDDLITVSVGSDCELDLDPYSVLEGNPTTGPFTMTLESIDGIPIDESDLSDFIGDRVVYTVVDSEQNSCWGHLLVEDKFPPTISCATCTENPVTDPACVRNCVELKLFNSRHLGQSKTAYDPELLDEIIVSSSESFVEAYVTDNCGQEVHAYYEDRFSPAICGEATIMTRNWYVEWTDGHGSTAQEVCQQFYRFDPIELFDDLGEPIEIIGTGVPIEDRIILPPARLEVHGCNVDHDPYSIAAQFDDPETLDYDSDGNGVEPPDDVDWVIENNEGIWRAFPHYYLEGLGDEGLHAQPLDKKICNIDVTYTDAFFDACSDNCNGSKKVSRNWTIYDWCTGEHFEYQQVIKITDSEPPTMDVRDHVASVDPWECSATVHVPAPEHLFDDCDDNPFYFVELPYSISTISGNHQSGYIIHDLPIGEYTLVYKGSDCCDNINRKEVLLKVVDKTPPVPVTIEKIVVDLVGTGYVDNPIIGLAKVYAHDIDNQSYDGCSDVEIYVRRPYNCMAEDTIWGDFVTFCCDDLAGSDHVLIDVEFKVVDKVGNENFAWSTVRLEDKGAALQCPPDMVLECYVDYHDFDRSGGIPTYFNACAEIPYQVDTLQVYEDTEPEIKKENVGNVPGYIGVEVPAYNPSCGFGAIRREFKDACVQWLVIEDPYDLRFDTSTIVFPKDLVVDCMDEDTGVPEWKEAGCNLIGYTVESDTFSFATGACYKVRNKWNIINWCFYEPTDPDRNNILDEMDADGDLIPNLTDPDDDNDGILDDTYYIDDNGTPDDPSDDFLEYEPDLYDPSVEDSGEVEGLYVGYQVIKLLDDEDPEINCIDEICFAVNSDCESDKAALTAIGLDQGQCPSPVMGWTVHIDLYDDWNFDYEYSSFIPKLINNEPNPFYLKQTGAQEQIVVSLPAGMAPSNQRHRADWILYDGCGNEGKHTTYFTIEDKTAPTPYCKNISTATMSNGQVELWAVDFDQNSFDHCSQDLAYTFTDVPPPPRCDDEYDNRNDRDWYDATYWFFDSQKLEDDPSDNDCDISDRGEYSNGGYDPATRIFTEYGGAIHKWVPSSRSSGAIFTSADVNPDGYLALPIYVWDGVGNRDFCLVTLRVIDNGGGTVSGRVRTEDGLEIPEVEAQLMSDSPDYPKYEMTDNSGSYAFTDNAMAMDYQISATKDGDDLNGISTRDLLAIQRHILSIDLLDSPYKMIAADINNDHRINGQDLVELRKLILGIYTELPQNTSWKIIDAAQQLLSTDPWNYNEIRNIKTMDDNMMSEDFIGVKVGDVDNSAELGLSQGSTSSKVFNLEYDDRTVEVGEFIDVILSTDTPMHGCQFTLDINGLEYIDASGQWLNSNSIASNENNLTISQGDINEIDGELMSIRFLAQESGLLSEMMAMTSVITKAEAYIGRSLETVNLELRASQENYALGQNIPNPFNSATAISYVIPEDMAVRMEFYDIDGRLLRSMIHQGIKGENTIVVPASDLGSGMIYYRMQTNAYTATRHMIVIE